LCYVRSLDLRSDIFSTTATTFAHVHVPLWSKDGSIIISISSRNRKSDIDPSLLWSTFVFLLIDILGRRGCLKIARWRSMLRRI